ncbi:MAG: MATE family efflux transporter [Clostridia bacterium]|nr:MATE family efflux transporter [Clostridia bacterium]
MFHIFQKPLKKIRALHPRNIGQSFIKKTFNNPAYTVSTSLGSLNVFSLALPLLLETVATRLIAIINSAVLSGYSENSVAAVGSTNTILNFSSIVFTVVSTGGTVVISNMIGAERLKKAFSTAFAQIVLCGFLGVLCTAVMLGFCGSILGFMNLEGDVLAEATIFYKIRVAALVVVALSSGLSALLRCFGHAKITVAINFVTIVISLVLNIYVIKFADYSPVTGVAGIALGTVIGQAVGLILNIYYIKKKGIKLLLPKSITAFFAYTKKILSIGIPAGLSGSTFSLSQVVSTSFIALIGTYALSGKVYYDNILCYAYLFSMSLGSANSLLVGRLVGGGKYEQAKALCHRLVKLTVSVNLVLCLLIIVFYKPLISIFTENPLIIQTALWVFIIDTVAELSRGVSQVYEYALRGAGDMKFMLIITVCSCWAISVGLAYLLSIELGFGIIGCYIAVSLDELIRAVSSIYRWKTAKWMRGH